MIVSSQVFGQGKDSGMEVLEQNPVMLSFTFEEV